MEGYKPAKKSVALAALGASVLLLLAFAFLLRADLRAPKALDPAEWDEPTPAGFVFDFTAEATGGALTINGWACVEGERLLTVETWVVLYHAGTGAYLRLPTVMEFNEAPTALLGGGITYDRAGLASITPLRYLAQPLDGYEVCFAYGGNAHSFLAHTGVMLSEGGGAA